MKKRLLGLCTLMALLIGGCAPKHYSDGSPVDSEKEKLIEVLTLFVEAVQGDRFEKAFDYLTPAERSKMADASGQASPIVRRQLKALRLSTLAQKPGVRLERGKVEGISAWLPALDGASSPPTGNLGGPLIQ